MAARFAVAAEGGGKVFAGATLVSRPAEECGIKIRNEKIEKLGS